MSNWRDWNKQQEMGFCLFDSHIGKQDLHSYSRKYVLPKFYQACWLLQRFPGLPKSLEVLLKWKHCWVTRHSWTSRKCKTLPEQDNINHLCVYKQSKISWIQRFWCWWKWSSECWLTFFLYLCCIIVQIDCVNLVLQRFIIKEFVVPMQWRQRRARQRGKCIKSETFV